MRRVKQRDPICRKTCVAGNSDIADHQFPVWSAASPNYFLTVVSLSLYPMAYITRLTKTSMLDSLSQDYVRTARAKGVPQVKVIFKHALRNALIPVVTYVGPMIAGIITGSMVVENIFTIGGLGSQFVTSINDSADGGRQPDHRPCL